MAHSEQHALVCMHDVMVSLQIELPILAFLLG